jgi:hypothetical protein
MKIESGKQSKMFVEHEVQYIKQKQPCFIRHPNNNMRTISITVYNDELYLQVR